MVSTTFDRNSELELNLPGAEQQERQVELDRVKVSIDRENRIYIAEQLQEDVSLQALQAALREQTLDMPDPVIAIHADENSSHQHLILVMDAANGIGLSRIGLATRHISDVP